MKRKTKNIISAILVIVLLAGAIMLLSNIFNKEKDSVSVFAWGIGSINVSNGNYAESKTSLYTKDLIPCKGLTVTPDFEASGEYQIFYYGADGAYLGSSPQYSSDVKFTEIPNDYIFATHCRITIIPDLSASGSKRIKLWETGKYLNYDIAYDKVQEEENILKIHTENALWASDYSETPVATESSFAAARLIDVSDCNTVYLRIKATQEVPNEEHTAAGVTVRIFNSTDKDQGEYMLNGVAKLNNGKAYLTYVGSDAPDVELLYVSKCVGEYVYLNITVPEDALTLALTYNMHAPFENYTLVAR